MIPCLYDSREMKFDHNGIGKLADAQSCTVTEKRNGSYELKLICPADGIHAEMLEEGNIILAKPSDTMQSQPFRIYKITTPIDGKLEVQARHISYQLNFITVSPFSVTGCVGAMQGLKSHAASDCPFEVWTDVESSATFTLGVPSSFRNCLGGMAGSVLDVFGGEFEWDRYTVKFHKARGADHNVHIIYGKNLTDFKMDYEEGSEIEAYASLAKDIRQRIESFRKEKETLSQEQGALTVMKKNFDLFIACLKELPEQNAAGMPLKVNGLDVQGSLFRDVDGKPVDGAVASLKRGRLKMTPERIAEAPDLLHFEKGIYCAFMKKGTVKGDIVLYETNFGVTLPTCGNQRTLTSFLGFKKCSLDGLVTLVDAPYRVYDNTVQYRRYLRSKVTREQAV